MSNICWALTSLTLQLRWIAGTNDPEVPELKDEPEFPNEPDPEFPYEPDPVFINWAEAVAELTNEWNDPELPDGSTLWRED